jgi:T-complex protein 1 subunit theta
MQKLIINHIDKLFVSNDASTILKEINVNHPAANLINMAAQV